MQTITYLNSIIIDPLIQVAAQVQMQLLQGILNCLLMEAPKFKFLLDLQQHLELLTTSAKLQAPVQELPTMLQKKMRTRMRRDSQMINVSIEGICNSLMFFFI